MEKEKVLWKEIDFVLLDLDGTLLDKYFDDYFWEEFIPQTYAALKQIPLSEARATLLASYKEQERKLVWTDMDYWSDRLGLNIPALKESVADRVAVHEGVLPFLQSLKGRVKQVAVLTNAHPKAVEIKLARTPLWPYLDQVVSADKAGWPKEAIGFWEVAQAKVGFDKERSLFVDDNEEILIVARQFGIRHLLYKSYASSQIVREDSRQFPSIRNFGEIMPPWQGRFAHRPY